MDRIADVAAAAQHVTERQPRPAARPEHSASLCVACAQRDRCLGGVSAQAGTAQLQHILAGRPSLHAREVLVRAGDAVATVYVVRSGSLMSTVQSDDGHAVVGLHFPGEVVGVGGMAAGRQGVTVTALEDAQLCALRFAPVPAEGAGARAFLSRLWDMLSCELVRERTHRSVLAMLPPGRRVAAFLASVAARRRGHAGDLLPPGLSEGELASYLQLPDPAVQAALG